jgi:hypothetical protein
MILAPTHSDPGSRARKITGNLPEQSDGIAGECIGIQISDGGIERDTERPLSIPRAEQESSFAQPHAIVSAPGCFPPPDPNAARGEICRSRQLSDSMTHELGAGCQQPFLTLATHLR